MGPFSAEYPEHPFHGGLRTVSPLLLLLKISYFYCIVFMPARMYVYASCACSVHKGQKKALDPLELKLQTVVNHHVGAGN